VIFKWKWIRKKWGFSCIFWRIYSCSKQGWHQSEVGQMVTNRCPFRRTFMGDYHGFCKLTILEDYFIIVTARHPYVRTFLYNLLLLGSTQGTPFWLWQSLLFLQRLKSQAIYLIRLKSTIQWLFFFFFFLVWSIHATFSQPNLEHIYHLQEKLWSKSKGVPHREDLSSILKIHAHRPGMVVHTCSSSPGRAETNGSLGLLVSQSSLLDEL